MLQKPLLVGLCVVMLVLFCGMFLGVIETIVGSPVCCCVGIVFWSVSWCCGNHGWLACVLLCGYCFVECFLVLRKPLLVRLCVVMLVLFCGVFLSATETVVGWPVFLCGYCFLECFLVLRKPLLVGLCVVMLVFFCGMFLGVVETIVGSPVC